MNIKVALKYRLYDSKKSILVFYLVIASIFALLFISSESFDSLNGTTRGIETASAIFLFVFGLNSFKEVFRIFMQNGISRKTLFKSQLLITLIICAVMSFIDNTILLIGKNILTLNKALSYVGIFEMMFGIQINSIGTILVSILFCFCIYTVFLSFGYLITTLYYRMNKGQKITVSIGVPTLLNVVLPILDAVILGNTLFKAIGKFFIYAFGSPLSSILSSIVFTAIFTCLSWLLVKKAVVKD